MPYHCEERRFLEPGGPRTEGMSRARPVRCRVLVEASTTYQQGAYVFGWQPWLILIAAMVDLFNPEPSPRTPRRRAEDR